MALAHKKHFKLLLNTLPKNPFFNPNLNQPNEFPFDTPRAQEEKAPPRLEDHRCGNLHDDRDDHVCFDDGRIYCD